MSSVQSPQILTDLYRDLRDRRLLPLVVVLAVGLAVVPIALSSEASPEPAAAPPPPAPVAEQSNAPPTQVVLSDPGLRDYQRRLSERTAKDPFIQLFSAPSAEDVGVPAGASSAEPAGGTAPGGTELPGGTTGGEAAPGPTTVQPQVETDTKVLFYRLKVRTGQVGGKMTTKDDVGASVQLPSKAVPALVFLGVDVNSDLEAQRAYFLVSNGVSALSGGGACSLGDPCQLVSIKPGQYVDLVWVDGNQYRVKLLAFKAKIRKEIPPQFGDGGSGGGSGSRSAG